MKNFGIVMLMALFSLNVFGQRLAQANYEIQSFQSALDQANKKKKTGKILLITGTAIAVTGAAFMISGLVDGGSFEAINDDDFESNDARFMGGMAAMHIGGGLAIASIPFFKKSKQLSNGASIHIKSNAVPQHALSGRTLNHTQLQLSLNFPLSK